MLIGGGGDSSGEIGTRSGELGRRTPNMVVMSDGPSLVMSPSDEGDAASGDCHTRQIDTLRRKE